MWRCVWLAIIAIGCGHPAPPSTPSKPPVGSAAPETGSAAPVALEDDPPGLAARAVKLYLDWQQALVESGEDCAAAAAKMSTIADANADLIAANARLSRAPRAKVLAVRAELDKREAEMGPAAKAISDSKLMAKCSSVAPFSKAVDRLAGEG